MTTLLTDINFFSPGRSFRRASAPVAMIFLTGLLPVVGCNQTHNADVVATVNGKAIMRAEMDKAYTAQLGDAQQQGQHPSNEQADSLRLRFRA